MTLSNSEFQRLARRAAKAAAKHIDLAGQLTAAFEERYGTTHSEIDADELIDCFDYGQTGDEDLITTAWVDEVMNRTMNSKLKVTRK